MQNCRATFTGEISSYFQVSAWMRYVFAIALMIAYVLSLTLHCDFKNRFPTETLLGIFVIILALLIFVGFEFELLIRADFYSHIHEDAKKKVCMLS